MSDSNKRRARKSKLVPRDYVDVDIEDEKSNKMQESPEIMPKIFIKSLDKLTAPASPSTEDSSIQFNVQVEVESCEDGDNLVIDESYFNNMTDQNDDDTDWAIGEATEPNQKDISIADNDEESLSEYMKFLSARSTATPVQHVSTTTKLTTEEILNEVDSILNNSHNVADQILSIEVKNIWGRLQHTPNKQDEHEVMIQEVLDSWMKWFHSKLNDPPLFYKCYVCEKAWWDLYDFREHIRNHRNLNVDIEAFGEQCCIGAYEEKPDENKQFPIDSDCWRCGKDFDSHMKPYYECGGCMLHFNSCIMLAEHEGSCVSYWYENNYDNRDKQDIDVHQCPLCARRLFSNYALMMKHMLAYHSVRSDRCTFVKTTTCVKCDGKYINYFTHYCRSKHGTIFCKNCDRRFSSKILFDIHQSLNKKAVKCKVCDLTLETQCKEVEHMLTHTEDFIVAFRCRICCEKNSTNMLILKRKIHDIVEHFKQCHKSKRFDNRLRDYDSVIIPTKLTQVKQRPGILEDSTSSGSVRERETNKRRTTKRAASKPSIIRKNTKSRVRSPRIIPNDNGTVLSTRLKNNVTKNLVKYTAIYKTNEDVNEKQNNSDSRSRFRKYFSNFNENDESNIENDDVRIEVFKHTTSNNSNNENTKCTNDINAPTSSRDIVIKQEINAIDDNAIDRNQDDVTIEESQVNIGIKSETDSDNANQTELLNTNDDFSTDNLDSDIKIKDEVLDDEQDPVNYDITIEETDISLSKVFRVSDRLKELTSKILVKEELIEDKEDNSKESSGNIKEEFDEDMLKNAEFEEMDNSDMFEPEVLIDGKNSKNDIYYCICGDFKGTFSEFRDHEIYCDNPVLKKYPISKKLTYMCASCDFIGTHGEFKDHEFDCSDPKKVRRYESHFCSKCAKDFGSMKDYLVHLKLHGVKNKCCPQCCMQLEQYSELKTHLHTHIKSLFVSMTVINKDYEKSPRVFKCKLCRGSFKTAEFFAHWEKHLKIKDGSSTSAKADSTPVKEDSLCDRKILESGALKDAIEYLQKRQRGSGSKVCVICQRFFERRNDVKRHIVEHLLNDAYLNKHKNDALTCQICGHMFKSAAQYKCHMRDHGDLPVFKCEICNKYFSDSSNFAKHKKIHNINVFQCDWCKKRFQVKTTLIKHMEIHNNQTEPLKCTKCDKQKIFYDFTSYRKHMRSYHSGTKEKHMCKICRKRFISLKEKWDHEWEVHKERKNVSDCPICKASFRKYMDVKNHMKEKHAKEWLKYSASLKSIFHNTTMGGILGNSRIFISNDTAGETLVVYE